MNFSYVDIVGGECKGWLNLFFGEFPVALVSNIEIADEMRRVIPKKTNKPVEPTARKKPIKDLSHTIQFDDGMDD